MVRPQLIIQSQVKFRDVIAAYRRTHIPTLKEISAREYLHVIEKWIEPHFGDERMCDIGIEEVQQWISSIKLSWRSKKQALIHFSMIWTKARQWGYTQTMTPAEGVSVGAQRDVFEHRILTLEEFQRLSAVLEEPYRLMAHVALFTGMRVSEIRGLIWKAIDFQTGSVRVERRLDAMDVIDVPKSRRSRRALPLGHLTPVLAARKPVGASADDLVFPGRRPLRRVPGEAEEGGQGHRGGLPWVRLAHPAPDEQHLLPQRR
jgi:integrase